MVVSLCEHFGTEAIIVNVSKSASFEEEPVQGVPEIVTVFSARLYGSRSHQNKELLDALSGRRQGGWDVTGTKRPRLNPTAKHETLSLIRRNNLGRRKLRVKRLRGEAAAKTVVRQALRSRPAASCRGPSRAGRVQRCASAWSFGPGRDLPP